MRWGRARGRGWRGAGGGAPVAVAGAGGTAGGSGRSRRGRCRRRSGAAQARPDVEAAGGSAGAAGAAGGAGAGGRRRSGGRAPARPAGLAPPAPSGLAVLNTPGLHVEQHLDPQHAGRARARGLRALDAAAPARRPSRATWRCRRSRSAAARSCSSTAATRRSPSSTPTTCAIDRQMSVKGGTFQQPNPHDVVIVSDSKAYVTRYEKNGAASPTPTAAGDDVLIIDPRNGNVAGRIDLASYATQVGGTDDPGASRSGDHRGREGGGHAQQHERHVLGVRRGRHRHHRSGDRHGRAAPAAHRPQELRRAWTTSRPRRRCWWRATVRSCRPSRRWSRASRWSTWPRRPPR